MESALAELRRRGADTVPHRRASLLRHLRGTEAILERWGQPQHVRLAGLMHSVYATDAFTHPIVERAERERIRALIGREAERLVFLFCSLDRRDLFSTIAAAPGEHGPLRLPAREGDAPLEIAGPEVGDLLVLYLANEAEQACRDDGSPATCLAFGSQLAGWTRDRARVVPPVFAAGLQRVEREDEAALLAAYAAAFADPAGAALVMPVLERELGVGEPLAIAALHALAAGDVARAAVTARRAATFMATWNTAWDKRLAPARWLQLADWIAGAERGDPARRAYAAGRVGAALRRARTPADLVAGLEEAGLLDDAGPPLQPRFAAYVAQLRDAGRATLQRYPGLTARPWHDPAAFGIVADLERHAVAVAAEARALGDAAFHAESENIARRGDWDVALLHERGRQVDEIVERAPVTTSVLARHRVIRGPAGLAYFSRLAPHTRIAPHAGPTNLRLRCHLALDVPPGCGLTVGGITGGWTPGRCIVFDDSFVHEAWNDGERDRVVLIVDLWHPDLSDDEVALLEGLQRHVAGYAANLRSYWERNDAARAGDVTSAPVTRSR